MEQLNFSNSNIDLACEEVGIFLTSVGVEKREALRIGSPWKRFCWIPGKSWALTDGWQLTMIHVADTLNMLDEEALHKNK